ncbi:MAG: biotin--[acetyl-CoA-carboxylase] ligase [candidate division Zixibacteria bacterium]
MKEPVKKTDIDAAAVLEALLDSDRNKKSFKDLELMSDLDRKTIKMCIENLRESGIVIDGRAGFSVLKIPDKITSPLLLCDLNSKVLGRNVYSYKSLGSTNEAAHRLAESGAPEGTIVIAEKQTRGRGRLGRKWHSPSGSGLFFSLILRPTISIEKLPGLSLVAALSICRVMERIDNLEPEIKWPNDCLIDSKKIAGILMEISAELDRISYAVVGIGINVNHAKKDFPISLRSRATSLALASGIRHDRVNLLKQFLYEFEKDYNNFVKYGLRFMGRALVERSSVLDKKITVRFGKRKINGMAVGLDENGALRLKTKDGVITLSAGEVTLR